MRIEVSEKEKAELIEHARQWGDWIQRSPCDERSLRAYYHGQGIGEALLLHKLGIIDQAEAEALRRELDAHRSGGE